MCGIVGLLLKRPELQGQLGELMVPMLIGMSDRGPDSAGMAVFTPPLPEGRRKLSLYSGLTAAGGWLRLGRPGGGAERALAGGCQRWTRTATRRCCHVQRRRPRP